MEPVDQRAAVRYPGAALPPSYFTVGTSSFSDVLAASAPELLPGTGAADSDAAGPMTGTAHGTTIVALTFRGGVVIAGDRRATMGNLIAQRDMEKVFVVDDYAAVGIAGSASMGMELARLFAVELQHYEKIEGVSLTLDGKVNKLAGMVRSNLGAALQGLAAIPLFIGFDVDAGEQDSAGRIFSFDVAGGRAEETLGYHAIGSGSMFAKAACKKLHDPAADVDTAIRTAMEALYDAADDDTATSGPDEIRRIYPVVITVTASDGAVKLSESAAAEVGEAVLAGRRANPGGGA